MSVDLNAAFPIQTRTDFAFSRVVDAQKDYEFVKPWVEVAGRHVLDLGCGSGGKAATWQKMGAAGVVGIDLAMDFPVILSLNKALFGESPSKPGFAQADGSVLPFKTESFDLVIMHDVVEHLDRPDLVLSECRRVLRVGGVLSILAPHYYGLSGNHLWSYIDGRLIRYLHPHLILPEPLLWWIIRTVGKHKGASDSVIEAEWHQYKTLNRLRFAQLPGLLQGFDIKHMSLLLPDAPVVNSIAKIPWLTEYLSYRMIVVAAKSATSANV